MEAAVKQWKEEGCEKVDFSIEVSSNRYDEIEFDSAKFYAYSEELESDEAYIKRIEKAKAKALAEKEAYE